MQAKCWMKCLRLEAPSISMFHGGTYRRPIHRNSRYGYTRNIALCLARKRYKRIANRIGCKCSFKNPWITAIQHPFTFRSITKTHFRFEFIHSPMINVLIVKPNPLCNPFWFLQVFTVIGTSHVIYSISSMFTG